MDEVQIKVEKAHPNDFGRGIIRLDPSTLLSLQLSPGDIVEITGKRKTCAKVWRADRQDWGQGIIRIDGFIRQNAGVSIGERVTVKKAEFETAAHLILAPPEGVVMEYGDHIREIIKRNILKRPFVVGDVIPIISSMTQPMASQPTGGQAIPLIAVEAEPHDSVLIVTEITDIELRQKPVRGYESAARGITYDDIGGLGDEIQRVREMIELPLKHPELFQRLNIEPPKGIILYGPPGTGKTLIAKAVANESKANFLYIAGPEIMGKYYGESEERIRKIFEEAEEDAPSIVFIDEIDSIAPKRQNVTGEVERRVVAQLLTMMDGLEERGQVVVIGATNRLDAIDPALRRPGRFDREIEIGVPDAEGRLEILQIHTRGVPLGSDADEKYLEDIAKNTQAFVGADLLALVQEAAMRALRRVLPDLNLEDDLIPQEKLEQIMLTRSDFENALREIGPSAMREVLVEIPSVKWADVGGLDIVKQEIIEAVEWPITKPEKFVEMGIKPPKGILLFGPPGTGKTLVAQAVANESNANFISIKGPEMLSKWVGESERAIREIFKKARQVAPCVVFFDEIDSIASARSSMSEDGKVSERVVNQLLTELDGLEALKEIVVIAATNRPDMIDPALLRAGRFDRLVLVGQSTREGRRSIFQIHTRNIPLASNVSIDELANITEGYVGADIEAVCREAVMLALREDFDIENIDMKYFMEALNKVRPTLSENLMGYYKKIHEFFKGGMPKEETSSYIGYR
ncbi:AAA family ATPase, CDC48 subfamily [Methanomethylovorans hollandica DSM 15978]|jgi:transitional endoplasmic reticulum ATPase|uniref:AAA family ATPase, CDC48 subfamily n=1 Tax=Methanomethylovorans hollandica (strain DSM 15978 / NBRC 107637 / DMS1) TaxID=867904 RepID=L0KZA9_METHD|nr:CDC48 family AAA ATPase [Methanomethylovorans hollandica]AGB50441.1 AAA family ATPase, CDC48 subfamily [Methanomethylovorans hollandica DSM 15978]